MNLYTASPKERKQEKAQNEDFDSLERAAAHFVQEFHRSFHHLSSSDDPLQVHLTKIIQADNLRAKDLRMDAAISDEVRDLLRRDTFKVILREEIPDGADELTARYVLTIRSKIDGTVKFKAGYVIGGQKRYAESIHSAQRAYRYRAVSKPTHCSRRYTWIPRMVNGR